MKIAPVPDQSVLGNDDDEANTTKRWWQRNEWRWVGLFLLCFIIGVIVASLGMEIGGGGVVEGRPFVDVSGGSLQALPLVADSCDIAAASWQGGRLPKINGTSSSSQRPASYESSDRKQHHLLGKEWVRRGLGEHASVASFSAFSISLMTNQAPSDLVEDALKAGLDEVRHAKTSFDIASRLTGEEVGPGPLPKSSHEFRRDLTALALAVAREGCVDETLSAIAAFAEAEHIGQVMERGVRESPYSGIDGNTLHFIRNELVAIANDESNHSALSWRTLKWLCGVDRNVCDIVHKRVFEESSLEMRFSQRADTSFGDKPSVRQTMREEWMKIFIAHRCALSGGEDGPVPGLFHVTDSVGVGERKC